MESSTEASVTETETSDDGEKKDIATYYKCTFDGCSQVFSKNKKLVYHLRLHNGERPFTCDVENCTKSYTNPAHLRRHKKTSHEPKIPIPCIFCDKLLSDEYSLKRHCFRMHNKNRDYRFKCEECNQGFHKKNQLLKHSYLHTGEPLFECIFCKLKFPSDREMKRHRRCHRTYKCEHCNVIFEQWTALTVHKKQCVKQTFACEVCKKEFSNQSNLNVHKKSHDDSRNSYKCNEEGCGRTYLYKKNLDQHHKSYHLNIKTKLKCPIEGCTALLSKMQNLKKHLDVHKNGPKTTVVRKPRKDKGISKISIAAALAGVPSEANMTEARCVPQNNDSHVNILCSKPVQS